MKDKPGWSNAKFIWKNRREPEIRPLARVMIGLTAVTLIIGISAQGIVFFGLQALGAPWLICLLLGWAVIYPVMDATITIGARFVNWWAGPSE